LNGVIRKKLTSSDQGHSSRNRLVPGLYSTFRKISEKFDQ